MAGAAWAQDDEGAGRGDRRLLTHQRGGQGGQGGIKEQGGCGAYGGAVAVGGGVHSPSSVDDRVEGLKKMRRQLADQILKISQGMSSGSEKTMLLSFVPNTDSISSVVPVRMFCAIFLW